ncbi:hypothetical protein L226DRAFT_537921 [Lentinus tigrinus ALCF2SS1-7]|uniref:SWI/SNF and RSC complexes subunit Ssr4 N-terminal domain-containing protein n=1 Tax=Lentinus tigrinus ALCF2SS1-6 TaxID=1328759 RepID=A0A5C2RZW7_9APHY|nr:hypothetical protein L227DRAFT_578588 [Lentinus tigrinus ALCF2SS1-6]RPD71654.1 hypothetical protein L226DRAFT_537921 [Lentinus tigrinus ALCF2SS1-7]
MALPPQAQAEGLCLRYPDPLGPQPSIPHETAVQMLLRAIQLSQNTPFVWGYIDKPSDGQMFLIFQTPQTGFPIDGIVYQDREQRYTIPGIQGRELEVAEVKFGFIPGVDQMAYRVRRRYRLQKGGHPQLVLVHYARGQANPIIPAMNQPVRNYPLRPVNEPAIFVMGERQGQKVYPGQENATMPPGMGRSGMNYGIPGMPVPGNPQAMLAQQNSNMEALERRRQRAVSMGQQQVAARIVEEDDSADESETISARTLALTRYRRNHEFMNEVFMYAAFGDKKAAPPPPPFSVFKLSDLEEKMTKLTAEIEELKSKSAARKEAAASAASELRDVPMEGLAITESAA